jgi:hypothetical protein
MGSMSAFRAVFPKFLSSLEMETVKVLGAAKTPYDRAKTSCYGSPLCPALITIQRLQSLSSVRGIWGRHRPRTRNPIPKGLGGVGAGREAASKIFTQKAHRRCAFWAHEGLYRHARVRVFRSAGGMPRNARNEQ